MNYNQKISKFNSSINEWQDSIYTYNKKYLNFILYNKNKIVFKLLDNYFNLHNKHIINYNYFVSNEKKNINILYPFDNNSILKEYNYDKVKKTYNLINIDKEYELDLIKKNLSTFYYMYIYYLVIHL